ncbi:hypothetical protein NMY22_g9026 [Coprinellus aureogranulatus]|nr:hypothetical protein NMY22_g9026 [Coprinellus aureogranulatus]
MGRGTKYYTHEERLAARRRQNKLRSSLPSVIASRSKSNHKQYVKKRIRRSCDVTLPSKIQHWASWVITSPDSATFSRFRAYSGEIVMVEEEEVGDEELECLSGLPPYPSAITALPDFEADAWDDISGALFGYQVRKLIEGQEVKIGRFRTVAIEDLCSDIRQEYDQLIGHWEYLHEVRRELHRAEGTTSDAVISHNLLWLARCAKYASEELETLGQAPDKYLPLLCDRNYALATMLI